MESRGRKRSQAWDSPQPTPGPPHPPHWHSLVQAADVLPLLAQPGPARLGFPGHVQICGERGARGVLRSTGDVPPAGTGFLATLVPRLARSRSRAPAGRAQGWQQVSREGQEQRWVVPGRGAAPAVPTVAPSRGCAVPGSLRPAEAGQDPVRVAKRPLTLGGTNPQRPWWTRLGCRSRRVLGPLSWWPRTAASSACRGRGLRREVELPADTASHLSSNIESHLPSEATSRPPDEALHPFFRISQPTSVRELAGICFLSSRSSATDAKLHSKASLTSPQIELGVLGGSRTSLAPGAGAGG